ncbi:polysaccharide lyase family 4 protein [Xylariaceae sp. FL1272]|nr:polysaccharide lyase family 4 protein [Xylariaceae sp. FL1272]
MLWSILFTFLFAWARAAYGITVTSSTASYVVDTASSYNFIVTISRSTCDITSLKFYGTEYQYQSTGSHIASGLGSGTSVSYTTSPSGDTVIFACTQSSSSFDLTHYMVFRNGEANIYMGTNINSEPSVGELRFIFRLTGLTAAYPFGDVSNTAGGTAIEGSDVYTVSSQTRSKFYSSERFIDDRVYCATDSGATVHACFVRPNHQATEKSSGGPFFRDIDLNYGGDYQSVTYYMNSGHVQTESYRTGFHGPYVFSMTRSGIPSYSSYDLTFFDSLSGLTNYVPISGQRGYVKGTATGVSSSFPIVVHWYNSAYQFWAYASSAGAYTSPPMPAGTYTMKLYQDEFLAATSSATVSAGSTATVNIAATSTVLTASRTTIFRLGDYDGQPTGFLNAANQLRMHPSDSRMSSWSPGTVSSTSASSWPMAIFVDVNNGQKISFSLSSAITTTSTLRIATTLSFAGGRPQPVINSYTATAPAAPTKIDSRGVTRGAYRGYGEVYEYTIPANTLVSGTNTITINVISGSSGDDYLSPNVIFDAIELFY